MQIAAWRRVTAIAVVVFWTAGAMAPLFDVHAGAAGDLACAEPGWVTPHPVTQFENVLPPVDDGHCEICHLQRAVRHALQISSVTTHPLAVTPGRRADTRASVPAPLDAHLAPRAPPSA